MAALTARELEMQMPDASKLMSDEPEMESSVHYMQLLLLVTCLEFAWQKRDDFFIGANLTIYFSRQQLKNRDFRGPDFFLVKNTTREPRNSWVVWEEDGRYPDLIIELLSDSTAQVDRTLKRDLYASRFHTSEYFYFSPDSLEFTGLRLEMSEYKPISPNAQGWLWSETLGYFLGIHERKLRYFSVEGALLPTPQDSSNQEKIKAEQASLQAEQASLQAEQERQRAEQERQRTEQERQRAEQERQRTEQANQRAEQASLQAEQERQRAEQASLQAEQARQRAEQERQRSEQAETQLQELQERMRSLGISPDK